MNKRDALISLFVIVQVFFGTVAAQDNRLVAMLHIKYDGIHDAFGAAIIVHHDEHGATLVTTAHTVIEEGLGDEKTIEAEFLASPEELYPAQVKMVHESPELDLAILYVPMPSDHASLIDFNHAKSALMPVGLEPEPGDGVVAVGFQGDHKWRVNRQAELIRTVGTTEISFETISTVGGASGGALFSEYGALLGMVVSATALEGRVLRIDTIETVLKESGEPFALKVNERVLPALAGHYLEVRGFDTTDALARAFRADDLDFDILHLYWIADIDRNLIEEFLERQVVGTNQTNAERLFDLTLRAASCMVPPIMNPSDRMSKILALRLGEFANVLSAGGCAAHVKVWFEKILQAGITPDLIVTDQEGYGASLLAIALQVKAVDASLLLLKYGATPNAYVDLEGRLGRVNPFAFPLEYVLENFSGDEIDRLWDAMLKAEVVALRSVREAGNREMPLKTSLEESVADCVETKDLQNTPWCEELQEFPAEVLAYNVYGLRKIQRTDWSALTFGRVVFHSNDRVFIVARSVEAPGDVPTPMLIEVNIKKASWAAFGFQSDHGCRKRVNGREPGTCWRSYPAKAGDARIKRGVSAYHAVNPISNIQYWGVGLSSKITTATERLIEAGFARTTQGDPRDYPDHLVQFQFSQSRADGVSLYVTLVGINNIVVGLSVTGSLEGDSAERLHVVVQQGADHKLNVERDELTYLWTEQSENSVRNQNGITTRATIDNGVSSTNYRQRASTIDKRHGYRALIWTRRSKETVAEASYWKNHLHDWLGRPLQRTDSRPCIDDDRHLRPQDSVQCKTWAEYSASVIAQNRRKRSVSVLENGVQFELLELGDGDELRFGDKVLLRTSAREYGANESSVSGFRGEHVIGSATGLLFWNQVLDSVPVGTTMRIVIPPNLYNAHYHYDHVRGPVALKVRVVRIEDRDIDPVRYDAYKAIKKNQQQNDTVPERRRGR